MLYVFQQRDKAAPRVTLWERKHQQNCCAVAKVKYFPCSCYRHYFASKLAADGIPLTTIQRKLGHRAATTTNNYLQEIRGV